MIRTIQISILFLAFIGMGVSEALAASRIQGIRYSIFTGTMRSRSELKSDTGADKSNTPWVVPTAGLGVEIRFKKITLELDGIFVKHRVEFIEAAAISKIYTWNAIQVPLLLRFHLGKKLSFAAGMYAEYAIGTVSMQSSTPTVVPSAVLGFHDFGLRRLDYGWVFDSQLNLPLPKRKSAALRINGRITHGLAELSLVTNRSRKLADYQLFVGLSFGKISDR